MSDVSPIQEAFDALLAKCAENKLPFEDALRALDRMQCEQNIAKGSEKHG